MEGKAVYVHTAEDFVMGTAQDSVRNPFHGCKIDLHHASKLLAGNVPFRNSLIAVRVPVCPAILPCAVPVEKAEIRARFRKTKPECPQRASRIIRLSIHACTVILILHTVSPALMLLSSSPSVSFPSIVSNILLLYPSVQ